MAHIHTEPGHKDLTITAFLIRTDTHEPSAFLHMHRKLNVLLPVGGHVELKENPWQAVAHELREESGYDLSDLKVLQPRQRITQLPSVILHPYPVVLNTHPINPEHSHCDIAFAFIADSAPPNNPSEGESSDIRWLGQKTIEVLPESEIYNDTKAIYQYIFEVCLKEWEAVPAGMYSL